MEQGNISQQQFDALEREIAATATSMGQYNSKLTESNSASSKLKSTIASQESQLSALEQEYTDLVLTQGKDSTAAKDLAAKYTKLSTELSDNKQKLSQAQSATSSMTSATTKAKMPLESLKDTISKQESELSKLSTEYQNACLQYGKNSTHPDRFQGGGATGTFLYPSQAQSLAAKIKTLSAEHQNCTKQLSGMESEAKKLTTAEQSLTQKLSSQKQDLTKLKQEYVNAAVQYGKNSSEAKSLEQQIKTLSGQIASEEKAVNKATAAADSFDKSMDAAGNSAKEAGIKAFEAYTAAVTGLATAVASFSLSTYADFESQMSTVKALMSGSCDSTEELDTAMDSLTEKAQELGSTTVFTSTEVGEAMEYMAMAGWSVDDTLNSVSAVMDLAAASGEDLATVSDIVTDSMTALGIAADGEYADGISNASHYADVLAATATSANTDVSTLGESFKYCAPIAGTLGASAEDLSIALGLMANSGIKGSQAGNSLKNALVNMSKPTEAQAAAMDTPNRVWILFEVRGVQR